MMRYVILAFFMIFSYLHSAIKEDSLNFKKYNLISSLPEILVSEKSEQIGATWLGRNIHDKPTIQFFYDRLNEKNENIIVFDIGAQTGCFSLLAKFLPNSVWYSFEPIKEAAEVLQTNLQINNIVNVSVIPKAVSDKECIATIKLPTDRHWGLTTLGDNPKRFNSYTTRNIQCIDLDTFIFKNKIEKVDFIKIDTEGWELFVLKGGKEMLKKFKPSILMEFNKRNMEQCNVDPNEVLQFINELGYIWYRVSSDDLFCIAK